MSTFEPVASNYKFTSEVRKYKQNDPYVWEVDNIPIRQLEDNTKYLKEQIENGTVNVSDVPRSALSELKPYVTGGNRVVNVSPGRFTARINTAKTDDELSQIYLDSSGVNLGAIKKFTDTSSYYEEVYNKLSATSLDASNSLNFNGLESLPTVWDVAGENSYLSYSEDTEGYLKHIGASSLPGSVGAAHLGKFTDLSSYIYFNLSKLHSKFVLRWGSVIRTAIVDVPSALSVEIDAWDDNDFTGSAGQATSRIDLVFIYAHPVDASSTNLPNQKANQNTTITKAQLGVLKGAGFTLDNGGDPLEMLANPNDEQAAANTGFIDTNGDEIHGSFPSPDDLLNIAPNLVAQIETQFNNPATFQDVNLIGQSVLAVAYVVVKKTPASQTANGKGILTTNDIIDIRPFFRTAELTYGERAGIAAASPPLSLGNPAVGSAQVNSLEKKLYEAILKNKTILPSKSAVVAKGTVYGGLKYGPEGTLMVMNGANVDDFPGAGLWTPDNVLDVLNFSNPTVNGEVRYIPELPEWDVRTQLESNLHEIATYINNKVTTGYDHNNAFSDTYYDAAPPSLSQSNITIGHDYDACHSNLRYVTKTVQIQLPDWATDYDVTLQYENCVPATYPGGRGEDQQMGLPVAYNGLFVAKRSIVDNVATFVIVCTIGGKIGASKDKLDLAYALNTTISDANLGDYSSFAVPFFDSEGEGDSSTITLLNAENNFAKAGVAIMPSVSFTVNAYAQENITFNGGSNV